MPDDRNKAFPGRFSTTQWSLVVASGGGDEPEAREALAELCRIYWVPVYAHLRRRGADAERALDLTQGFFTKLLEKNYVSDARQERGRFRTFLLTSLTYYTANEWDRERALKRGGGVATIPIDGVRAEGAYRFEPSHDDTPEKVFDRRWARTLLHSSLDRLQEEMSHPQQSDRFTRLVPFLVGESDKGYREVSAEMGISESAARVQTFRMKQRFRAILREEVSRTLVDPSQVDAELQHLFSVVGS